jgi:hypothetical protein
VASPRPPKGYHTASRGQSQTTHASVVLRVAPKPPRGRAQPGRRDATHSPAPKTVGDHAELMTFGHFMVTKHCDDASATIDATNATSKAARARERRGAGRARLCSVLLRGVPSPRAKVPRSNGALVVSSLVSSVYVRLGSLVFDRMWRCRSRTLTAFGERLSRLLKIGRSAVHPRHGDHLFGPAGPGTAPPPELITCRVSLGSKPTVAAIMTCPLA